ncbi:hypothetical protein D3C72_2235780 [compost metagenome]
MCVQLYICSCCSIGLHIGNQSGNRQGHDLCTTPTIGNGDTTLYGNQGIHHLCNGLIMYPNHNDIMAIMGNSRGNGSSL